MDGRDWWMNCVDKSADLAVAGGTMATPIM
jgi:hypothetical protein